MLPIVICNQHFIDYGAGAGTRCGSKKGNLSAKVRSIQLPRQFSCNIMANNKSVEFVVVSLDSTLRNYYLLSLRKKLWKTFIIGRL